MMGAEEGEAMDKYAHKTLSFVHRNEGHGRSTLLPFWSWKKTDTYAQSHAWSS